MKKYFILLMFALCVGAMVAPDMNAAKPPKNNKVDVQKIISDAGSTSNYGRFVNAYHMGDITGGGAGCFVIIGTERLIPGRYDIEPVYICIWVSDARPRPGAISYPAMLN